MKGEPKLRSVGKNLTAGAANTIYTCPAFAFEVDWIGSPNSPHRNAAIIADYFTS